MKIRDVINRIETDGWIKVARDGSHRQYKHPAKKGRVTVAGALNDDVQVSRYAADIVPSDANKVFPVPGCIW